MKKLIQQDAEGDETLLPLFVMAASVLVAITLLSTYTALAIERNQPTAYWNQPEGYEMFGGIQYNFVDPIWGYNVTMVNHTTNAESDNAQKKLEFDYSTWDYMTVRLVRNFDHEGPYHYRYQYDDFINIHVKKGGETWGKDRWIELPLDGSLTHNFAMVGDDQTATVAYFQVFNSNFSVVLTVNTTNTTACYESIMAGNYNIRIGYNEENDPTMTASMWTILGQILTLQLPDIGRIGNILLATPIWAAMGFFVFTVLSRVIPFISGG